MTRMVKEQKIIIYSGKKGREPLTEWLDSLKDKKTRLRIMQRIGRLTQGNFGDCKILSESIWELRIHFGPGYRIYFGKDGDKIVVLLCGGKKPNQSKDIADATEYWNDYQRRKK